MRRGPLIAIVVVAIAAIVVAIVLANNDGGTGDSSTTTSTPPSAGATVSLTTSDGLQSTLDVTSCDNPAETTVSLVASNESADLELDATGGTGTIIYESSDGRREGTVDSVQVGDTGAITASGTLAAADDDSANATFELTGTCAG